MVAIPSGKDLEGRASGKAALSSEGLMSQRCCLCGGAYSTTRYRIVHSVYLECKGCHSWKRSENISSSVQRSDFRETYGEKKEIRETAINRKRIWPDILNRIENENASAPVERRVGAGAWSLLDIGCGYGDFLLEARSRGWRVEGIEIDRAMREEAVSRGLKVTGDPLVEAAESLQLFETVTYLNVLDSIDDPVRELKSARRILEPGGVLWIRVPNGDFHVRMLKWASRIKPFGRFYLSREWSPLNAWIYSARGIAQLLESTGFSRVLIEPASLPHRSRLSRAGSFLGGVGGPKTGDRAGISSSFLIGARVA